MTNPKSLTFLAVAERDIDRAVAWYDAHGPGLGDAFLADLDELLDRIDLHPEMYQTVVGTVRRAVFHGFPYSVLYRILPGTVEVVGVLHSHVHPGLVKVRSRAKAGTQ